MTEIRKATIEDLHFVAELFDLYRVFYEKETNKEKAENFISERIKLKDSKIFVAENEEKKIVGFVQLYPIFSSIKMQQLWLLNDLFVCKEHRGEGVSKQLIETAKQLCKQTDASGLFLETAKTNIIGNELYQKVGFSIEKEYNYYFWDNN